MPLSSVHHSAEPVSVGAGETFAEQAESGSARGTLSKSTEVEIVPLDQLEKQAILSALKSTGGNRTKTAELLKISIRTLRNKLQEYRASGDFMDGDESEG
jgi:DNA-binding NtrC family response regulator